MSCQGPGRSILIALRYRAIDHDSECHACAVDKYVGIDGLHALHSACYGPVQYRQLAIHNHDCDRNIDRHAFAGYDKLRCHSLLRRAL